MMIYVPMSLVASWYIENHGIRKSVVLGSLISLVGFIVRSFMLESFWYVIAGQTIMAFGYPFILNLPAKISAQWFKKEARLFTTMTATNICLIGYISVYDLSNYMVTLDYNPKFTNFIQFFRPFTPIDCQTLIETGEANEITKIFKKQIYQLMLILAVLQIVVFFLILFLFKNIY